MITALVAVYALFAPTINRPASAQALHFKDEDRLNSRLKVAKGYRLNLFAASVGLVRVMRQTAGGNFIVTAARNGRVLLVRADKDGDGRSDGVEPLLDGMARPHGLIVEGDAVYIAESHRVSLFRLVNENQPGAAKLKFEGTILGDIPADGGHSTRTIGRGPDGNIYVSVGSSCNVCIESHDWRAAIVRVDSEGRAEVFARGLRNSVGLDWRPGTGDLYAVNAGRDRLGDDYPREEMNRVMKGAHYGWPFANENNVPDPDYGKKAPADAAFTPPAHMFTAHSTPLSIRFLRHQGNIKPGSAALVARHGSWNRSRKSGYDVVLLRWQADGSIAEEPFITGFEVDEDVIGRPVGIFETTDGTIYITDDHARVIYRVIRQP
ncbi:MAG: sorbosone dehydrogenase family protein [Rhizobiales bacterium]|nr:sorbosone dehydrogenase family protein [Hyphomicrobiales bacterium]